eukprot:5167725-Amphidinium_carterae.1
MHCTICPRDASDARATTVQPSEEPLTTKSLRHSARSTCRFAPQALTMKQRCYCSKSAAKPCACRQVQEAGRTAKNSTALSLSCTAFVDDSQVPIGGMRVVHSQGTLPPHQSCRRAHAPLHVPSHHQSAP